MRQATIRRMLALCALYATTGLVVGSAHADVCSCDKWPVQASGPGVCAVRETQGHCSITFSRVLTDAGSVPSPAAVEEKIISAIAQGDEQKKSDIERITKLFAPVSDDFLQVMKAAEDKDICQKFGCTVLTASQVKTLIDNEVIRRNKEEHAREVARQDTINFWIAVWTAIAAIVSLIGLWFSLRRRVS
jgi:hypothetical protein